MTTLLPDDVGSPKVDTASPPKVVQHDGADEARMPDPLGQDTLKQRRGSQMRLGAQVRMRASPDSDETRQGSWGGLR